MPSPHVMVDVDGREVRVTNPQKVYFPKTGTTKMDVVEYYLSVASGALIGCRDRPTMLHRYPDGVDGEEIYQKRVPNPPEWLNTITVTFPSGREARFLAPLDAAHLVWAVNLGCFELNPWSVRGSDIDHPDELRIDLDPHPDTPWDHVRRVAMAAKDELERHGLTGFPKTSGKGGMHVYARIEQRWTFQDVRRAALALARDIETVEPEIVTTAYFREDRKIGVFVDYNQNARDRTIASVYSIRPTQDARVSCALRWDEVPDVEPGDLTMFTVPERCRSIGDPGAAIDDTAGSIEPLLELAARQEAAGAGATGSDDESEHAEWPQKGTQQGRSSRARFQVDE